MRALMCPPDNYRINWADSKQNPWMNKNQQPDRILAEMQWRKFRYLLKRLGVTVFPLPTQRGLGDQMFVANGAALFKLENGSVVFVKANLAPEHRKPESRLIAEWLFARGFNVFNIPDYLTFEGQGDIITTKEAYLYFYGIRNTLEAAEYIERAFRLQKPIIPIRLTDSRFYHGDLCARYAAYRDAILFYPGGIDADGIRQIERLKSKKKEMSERYLVQATEQRGKVIGRNFPLNGCYVGKHEIFPWDETLEEFPREIKEWVEKDGGEVVTLNYSEMGLSGAGPRCTVLFLE